MEDPTTTITTLLMLLACVVAFVLFVLAVLMPYFIYRTHRSCAAMRVQLKMTHDVLWKAIRRMELRQEKYPETPEGVPLIPVVIAKRKQPASSDKIDEWVPAVVKKAGHPERVNLR